MKLPDLFKKRKKLEATARRAAPAVARDFDEPSIKLSSAVIVVLILHIVAIGGIYAFSSIKAHRGPAAFEPVEKKDAPDTSPKVVKEEAVAPSAAPKPQHATAEKTTEPAPKKTASTSSKSTVKDSGDTYVVAKGDKLATIAKKLHVNSDDLMKLNKIDDPKKLQIGQKLRVPVKRPAGEA